VERSAADDAQYDAARRSGPSSGRVLQHRSWTSWLYLFRRNRTESCRSCSASDPTENLSYCRRGCCRSPRVKGGVCGRGWNRERLSTVVLSPSHVQIGTTTVGRIGRLKLRVERLARARHHHPDGYAAPMASPFGCAKVELCRAIVKRCHVRHRYLDPRATLHASDCHDCRGLSIALSRRDFKSRTQRNTRELSFMGLFVLTARHPHHGVDRNVFWPANLSMSTSPSSNNA